MKYFNYQEQLLLWEKNQLLLQKKYADTSPGFSSAEEEETAWQAWEAEYALYLENGRYKIDDIPLPSLSLPLIGREAELETLRGMLADFHTAFLYGMGGIGKTSIALQYIADHLPMYDHVLYVLTDKGIVQAICDDSAISVSGLQYDRKKYPIQRQYFREKLRVLRELCENNKILIVIDNMNAPADKDLRLFLELPCDKIITTRVNYETVPAAEKLLVKALKPEHWPGLISECSVDLNSSVMEQLIRYGYQVEGHTLSLKMASVQASYGEFSGFLNIGFDLPSLLSAFRLKKNEWKALLFLSVLAPQGMEKELFMEISGTSEKTLQTLRNYLLIDFIEENKTALQSPKYTGKEKLAAARTETAADDSVLLRIHPLISEAVKQITPPNCINSSRLLRGFETYLYADILKIGTWNRTYEENRKMEPHIFALYETFPEPAPWLGTAFEEIATFLWIQGYYEEALSYALKIYENVLDYYGPNHVMPGREALRVAAVYHNYLDHDHALLWYQKGYELLKEVRPQSFAVLSQLSTACTKLAREAGHRSDWAAYKKYSAENRQILDYLLQVKTNKLSDAQKQQLELNRLYSLLDEAKLCLRIGQLAASKEIYHTIAEWMSQNPDLIREYRKVAFEELHISILIHGNHIQAAEEMRNPESSEKTDSSGAVGKTDNPASAGKTDSPGAAGKTDNPGAVGKTDNPGAVGKMTDLEEAEKIARENVRSALLYRGEKFKDYLSCLEVLANVLTREGKDAEALSVYEKILIQLQKDYPYEQKWIHTTMGKIQAAHARVAAS